MADARLIGDADRFRRNAIAPLSTHILGESRAVHVMSKTTCLKDLLLAMALLKQVRKGRFFLSVKDDVSGVHDLRPLRLVDVVGRGLCGRGGRVADYCAPCWRRTIKPGAEIE